MNPNYQHIPLQSYPSGKAHINPLWQWGQHQVPVPVPAPTICANLVHVNPIFFQSQIPIESNQPSNNRPKIIINPKFFPHVNLAAVAPVALSNAPILVGKHEVHSDKAVANGSNSNVKPQPEKLTHSPHGEKGKISKINSDHGPAKNRYKWRKTESPVKTSTKLSRYKLVRKGPSLKSPKLSPILVHTHRRDSLLKWATPSRLTHSTPLGAKAPAKSRFKLDNRKKKALGSNKSPGKLPHKEVIRTTSKVSPKKQQPHKNKCWRLSSLVKWSSQRSVVSNNFTNFKTSSLSRSQLVVHRRSKLQRLVAAAKTPKVAKKTKSVQKGKGGKRYYDEAAPRADDQNHSLDDVEIAVKPTGSKTRSPLGTLPSFITL